MKRKSVKKNEKSVKENIFSCILDEKWKKPLKKNQEKNHFEVLKFIYFDAGSTLVMHKLIIQRSVFFEPCQTSSHLFNP